MKVRFSGDAALLAGYTYIKDGARVNFWPVNTPQRRGVGIIVLTDADGNLDLQIERSASHRELARALGAIDLAEVKRLEKAIVDAAS